MIRIDYPLSTVTLLPAALRVDSALPFVGRAPELAVLRMLLPRLAGERRRAALIAGAAGAGKSRLVREFARLAADDGALVLYGACDPVARTPYRPFVEALEHLFRSTATATLREDLGKGGGELSRLLPDIVARFPGLAPPVAADPDTERHRLHTAVADLLASVGRRQPILLALEDWHWADPSTLLLLRHLVRPSADARMLIVATFRDTEAEMPAELADALADLRRSEDVARLRLVGLTTTDVAEFVRSAAGGGPVPEPGLAAAIGGLTGGNAFLLCELWRTLAETGALTIDAGTITLTRPVAELATPESVREVVNQRLSRLDPVTRDVLEIAAIAGSRIDLASLQGASALDSAAYGGAVEEAQRSGMIEEVSGPGLVYRFTHELVRRALSDRLTGVRRAELHLRVGEALEAAHSSPGEAELGDLADHFTAAAPLGDPARAIDYNLRAAASAASALAFDEAAGRLRAALLVGIDDERRRIAVLLELGTVDLRAGASSSSLESFRMAAGLARRIEDAELLARAAIGFEEACWRPSLVDAGARELLEDATAALSPTDSTLAVRLLAGLARALDFQGDHVGSGVVRDRAIAMARRLDDRHGLATVLMRSYWALGEAGPGVTLDRLSEAQAIGEEIGDVEIQAEVRQWRISALIALPDLVAARRELATQLTLAERTGQPFVLHVAEHYNAALALNDGRLAAAEAAAERSREWSRLLTGRDPSGVYGIQMFSIRREQGRLTELAPVVRVVAGGGDRGAWRAALAALFAEVGMEADARDVLDRLVSEGLDSLRHSLRLASLTYVADAAAAVAHEGAARLAYSELEGHAGTNTMIGHGVACYGAADRYLGMLAVVLGDAAAAERHYTAAMALNRRLGADTWIAHTAYQHARMLLTAGGEDALERATMLLAEAGALAGRIGMPTLVERVRAIVPPPKQWQPLPDGISPREAEILRLVARGLSNRQIGHALVISEHTAANHVRSILRKTGSANRTEAASYAHLRGVVAGR